MGDLGFEVRSDEVESAARATGDIDGRAGRVALGDPARGALLAIPGADAIAHLERTGADLEALIAGWARRARRHGVALGASAGTYTSTDEQSSRGLGRARGGPR